MLKPVAFANAFAIVGVGLYVGCRVLAFIVPDFLFALGQSWFHALNLNAVRGTAPWDLGTFLLGGFTTAILVWLLFYSGAVLYNRLAK